MRNTVLIGIVACLVAGCSERSPQVVDAPAGNREPRSLITAEFLSEHGFSESEGGPGIFTLLDIRLGDACRDLGFKLTDLRRTPSQPDGTDVRTVKIRNLTFVVRARTAKVDGDIVIESLDHPNSFCTISVALNQVPPEREMTKKGESPNQ